MIDVKKDNPLYVYKPLTFYHHGPNLPTGEEISKRFVLANHILFNIHIYLRLFLAIFQICVHIRHC